MRQFVGTTRQTQSTPVRARTRQDCRLPFLVTCPFCLHAALKGIPFRLVFLRLSFVLFRFDSIFCLLSHFWSGLNRATDQRIFVLTFPLLSLSHPLYFMCAFFHSRNRISQTGLV